MLSEEQKDALEKAHKKIGVISWEGHEIVFRRPTRTEWHNYMRMNGDAAANAAALDSHAQITLVAYDGDIQMPRARIAYTNELLEECPGFANAPEVAAVLAVLAGTAQQEDLANLGKVARVRQSGRRLTPTASPNGSPTSPEAPSSPTTDAPRPS